MIPPLFKNSWRGLSGVPDPVPQQHDAFSLAPGSLGTLAGQQYSLLVGDLTPALGLVYAALGHTHAMADIIGLGSAAAADVTDFAAALHSHTLADITDAGTAAAAAVGDFAPALHTHPLADIVGAGTAAAANVGDFAPASHTHPLADITGAGTAAAANVGDFAAASHVHAAGDITSGTVATARLGSGTANSTTYLRGDQTWAAIAAGIGGSTGSADNRALRSDGTGGATLQNSGLQIDDVTASTQQNLALINVDAAAKSALVLTPKGVGSFILGPKPTGAATTGNARGDYAVDLQLDRSVATQVASGTRSFAAGTYNTVNNGISAAIGHNNNVSGGNNATYGAYVLGSNNSGGGIGTTVCGNGNSQALVWYAGIFGNFSTVNNGNSFAYGSRVTINHDGCVVIGSDNDSAVSSDRTRQFKVKANGGMTHQTDGGTYTDYGKRAAAPSPVVAGDRYYDTATNKLRVYNGTIWNDCW